MKYHFLILFFLFEWITANGQDIKGKSFVSQPPSGPENYLIFENDNKVIYSIDFLQAYIGNWIREGERTNIIFKIQTGKRGYGKINPTSSMDYYGYSNYQLFKWEINKEANIKFRSDSIIELKFNDIGYSELFYKTTKVDFDKSVLNVTIPGQFSIASTSLLSKSDLEKYNRKELRLMRNEIFARYGYVFKSSQLSNYFEGKQWYKPDKSINSLIDDFLSEIEKKNIQLIRELELK